MLARVRAASVAARENGSLKSIETTYSVLPGSDDTPPFMIRMLQNLTEKKAASTIDVTASAPKPKVNPFLPYEQSMYVQHLRESHVLLLNKFNVVENHTLMVTSKFEAQNDLLTAQDFVACCTVLNEINGVIFYNAGKIAGASQIHKHMQHVPTPMIPSDRLDTPFDEALECKSSYGEVYESKQLKFVHAVVKMDDVWKENVDAQSEICMQRYTDILLRLGKRIEMTQYAYNLLLSRKWMVLVPRREECFQEISVNSLGFAGCLLVKNQEQFDLVKQVGGMTVLQYVAFQEE